MSTTLKTERLVLAPLSPADLDAFQRLHADERVTRYLAPSRPLTKPESFRLLAQVLGHWQLRDFGYWAVLHTDGSFLGIVGLWFPEGWPGVELGWRFGSEHWGKGYALEASRALLSYAFERLALPEVISIIRTDNTRSVQLAQRLGMTCYGSKTITDVEVVTYGISRTATD